MSQLDTVCPRCGSAPEIPEHTETAGPEPSSHQSSAKPKTPSQPPRKLTPLLVGALLVLAILGSGVVCYLLTRGQVQPQPAGQLGPGAVTEALPDYPRGPALPAASSGPSLPLPSGIGTLFEAQPSPHVTPTIVMANHSDETIHVNFHGPAEVAKTMPPHDTIEFQLPRGTYSLAMWSYSVLQQQGTAVFKARTRYTSEWDIIQVAPWEAGAPLRMGDIE